MRRIAQEKNAPWEEAPWNVQEPYFESTPGYSNEPTKVYADWLINDPKALQPLKEWIEARFQEEDADAVYDNFVQMLQDSLYNQATGLAPPFADFVYNAIHEINWDEVAEAVISVPYSAEEHLDTAINMIPGEQSKSKKPYTPPYTPPYNMPWEPSISASK